MPQTLVQGSALEQITGNYSLKVTPIDDEILNEDQRDLLSRLDNFEAPYLEEKLLEKGALSSKKEYQEAFTEFKKYAALSQIAEGPLGMSSPKVDEVWHQFILFTRQYADFCENVLGGFLHHSPHTSQTSNYKKREGSLNFSRAYQQNFGEIPEIWRVSTNCDDCWDDDCDSDCSQPSCDDR